MLPVDHDEFSRLLAVYSLDALPADEVPEVEDHLADCARCQAELASLRDVASLLGNSGATLAGRDMGPHCQGALDAQRPPRARPPHRSPPSPRASRAPRAPRAPRASLARPGPQALRPFRSRKAANQASWCFQFQPNAPLVGPGGTAPGWRPRSLWSRHLWRSSEY